MMIYEFLKKETEALLQELNINKNNLLELEIKRQEAKRFIRILDETTDRKYAGFTPYEVNKEEDMKIDELKQELKLLEEHIKPLEIKLSELEKKAAEYEKMTKYAKLLENINKEE